MPKLSSGGGRAARARAVLISVMLACVVTFAMIGTVVLPAFAAETGGKQKKATAVDVDEVRRVPAAQTVPVIGRLVASQSGVVAARIGGPIGKMEVQVGDRVEKGQVVAVLVKDSLKWKYRLQQARSATAEAALKTAKARLQLRRQELKRLRGLKKSAAFSQARFDDKAQEVVEAESAVGEADGAAKSAMAELKLAAINLYNADVRAPYGGVVTQHRTVAGAYVNTGDAVVSMVNDNSLEIEADVPANRLAGLAPGTRVSFRLAGKKTYSATVRARVPDENPLSRTRRVRFVPDFTGKAGKAKGLAAGQSVTLAIPAEAMRQVLTVDKDAILKRKGMSVVFVVGAGNAAMPRPVKLGEAVGGRFIVLGGLKPGELVVVRGNERLHPGQKIRFKSRGS
jgi:RND family efflux transporter MFP subunit